jgi:alginate O-acetyltransferase complex protein AlgI
MLFHSIDFFIFFIFFYSLYLTLPHIYQNRLLLIASYVFYGSWDWRYLSLLVISTTVDFFCGIKIQDTDSKSNKKKFVAISIFVNLSILGVFKYYNFFAENFKFLLEPTGLVIHPYFLDVALPLGISFYTFQTMSYSIDVCRGKLKPARNYFDFALYVSFFPQLIAGPIERGVRLLPQILNKRELNKEKIYQGFYLILWGIFLKVFVADNLAKVADPVFENFAAYDGADILIAVYAFSVQIYCDFGGYSLMAIGLGLTMGIQLMENFRRPYFSKNISDFWRRWHISLSSWFRDYMFSPFYIYLGSLKVFRKLSLKKRHGIVFFLALLSTEFLLGMWHGAGWNFGFFGIYHGFMIGVYYWISKYWDKLNGYLQIFLTFHVAAVGWLIFRTPTLGQANEMFFSIINNFQMSPNTFETFVEVSLIIIVLLIVEIFQEVKDDALVFLRGPKAIRFSFIILLTVLMYFGGDFSDRPFIYFQF